MAEAAPSQPKIPAPPRIVGPKKEPTKSYEVFVIYYELGEARSFEKLSKSTGKTPDNYRKVAKRWWWDERIAAQADEVRTAYRQALHKRVGAMADKVLSMRLEILETQLKAAKAIQAKADLITSLPVTEQTITKTSPDGKTQYITIKPVGVRATDGGRLALMADALIRSLTQQTAPFEPRRGRGFNDNGIQPTKQPPLPVEIFIDNGDGTRGKWDEQPPPDVYVPGNDLEDEEADEPTMFSPDSTIPSA